MNAIYAAKRPIGHIIDINSAATGVILGFLLSSFGTERVLHNSKNERIETMKYENAASSTLFISVFLFHAWDS